MNYRITTHSDELYHYGVLGMHWGIRRYQDYNGKRLKGGKTVARPSKKLRDTIVGGQGGKATGAARLAANASGSRKDDSSDRQGWLDRTVKQGKGRENISPAEDVTKNIRNSAENAKPLLDIAEKHDPKIKEAREEYSKEAKKMSDKELREKINRIKMEREYTDLKTADIDSGYQKAKEVLDVAGDVAGIVLAVLGIAATIKGLHHMDLDEDVLAFIEDFSNVLAQDGLTLDDISPDFLEHHGILGQKWGVRRFQNYDGTRIDSSVKAGSDKFHNTIVGGQGGKATGTERLAAKASFGSKPSKIRSDGKDESKFTPQQKQVSRDAKKDAEEFARAKVFYGEGAGNRRKAIKTTVEAKKKKNSFYAEEFEYHLSQQDMEEHMRKAKMERSQRDTATNTRKALNKTNRALGQLARYL